MGQKTNPIGNRIGIIRGWDSTWFDSKGYAEKIEEDYKVRDRIRKLKVEGQINNLDILAAISNIYIERKADTLAITIEAGKPGYVIGKEGLLINKIASEVKRLVKKDDVKIDVVGIPSSSIKAILLAKSIASQIESRVSFKRAMRFALGEAIKFSVKGVKIQLSGRLGGHEIARSESVRFGRIPLSTFRADLDYAFFEAHTTYGRIGVKVWLMNGEVYGARELSPLIGLRKSASRQHQGGHRDKNTPFKGRKSR